VKEAPAVPAVTKRTHLITFLGALFACAAAVLWMVGPYLLSLFLGGTLAMLAYPGYQWLLEKKCGPRLAASAVTAILLLLFMAPLTGIFILSIKQGIAISREMAELKEFSPKALTASLSRWPLVRTLIGDPAQVNTRIKDGIQATGQFTSSTILKLGSGVPKFLLQLFLALIAFFFFLLNGEQFAAWLTGLDAFDRSVRKKLAKSFRDTTVSAVLAGLAAAAAQTALIMTGFLIIDVPGAFLAGGLTFIFAWIPMMGTAPASLAGMIYLYVTHGAPIKMVLMIVLALAAGVIDNLIRPLVLKGRADMHPLVGLIAILSGIQLFGILGVFIGPILAAMLISLLKIWPDIRGRFGIDSGPGR